MKRWEFERAVLASDLPAPARTILLTLAVFANWPGGLVPVKFGPSLTGLAEAAGLARRTVANHLNDIEKAPPGDPTRDGWVSRRRPAVEKARSDKERTQYQLSIPASARPALEKARSSAPAALASAGDAPELVQEMHRASAGDAHNQTSSRPSSSSSRSPEPVTAIATALSMEEDEAKEIYNQIASDPRIDAPSRYIRRLIETGDIAKYRRKAVQTAQPAAGPTHPFQPGRLTAGFCETCQMPASRHRAA